MYLIISSRFPFTTSTDILPTKQIEQSYQLIFPKDKWGNISQEAKDLIALLLLVDPLKRITIREACLHPWITDDSIVGSQSSQKISPVKEIIKNTSGKKNSLDILNEVKRKTLDINQVSRTPPVWHNDLQQLFVGKNSKKGSDNEMNNIIINNKKSENNDDLLKSNVDLMNKESEKHKIDDCNSSPTRTVSLQTNSNSDSLTAIVPAKFQNIHPDALWSKGAGDLLISSIESSQKFDGPDFRKN